MESIDRSFQGIKKVLANKKKNFSIERTIVQGLVRLLLPFKELIVKIQTNTTPSLHFVLIGVGSLQSTLSSFDSLLEYEKRHRKHDFDDNIDSLNYDEANSMEEDEGNYERFIRLTSFCFDTVQRVYRSFSESIFFYEKCTNSV